MNTAPIPAHSPVFRYQNPISNGINPHGIRDGQVFRDGNKWYMTGTAWPHWEKQEIESPGSHNPGVVIYSSDTLTQWQFEKVLLPPGGPDKWYHRRFWAPEIHKIKGKYYALFSANNPELNQRFGVGFAVADSLLGPYRMVTEAKPMIGGIDLTLFEDTDGKVWAFWNGGDFAEVDLNTGKLLTTPQSAIQRGSVEYAKDAEGKSVMENDAEGIARRKVAKYHEWDSIGIEGVFVIKQNSIYYLFYSSWTRGYEIGYATATAITGPWVKAKENPFYGGQSEEFCKQRGLPYTGNPDNPFDQVGHNAIFTGPDGKLWLSCHGILEKTGVPMLVIDPLEFESDGRIIKKTPSYTPQEIRLT